MADLDKLCDKMNDAKKELLETAGEDSGVIIIAMDKKEGDEGYNINITCDVPANAAGKSIKLFEQHIRNVIRETASPIVNEKLKQETDDDVFEKFTKAVQEAEIEVLQSLRIKA